jgi:sialate O-acetylesterase
MTVQSYDESLMAVPLNHSNLFNSMIYPFTRLVIYGIIWYQGEQNWSYNRDKYACSFSKLIYYWRQIWNERTNGITDIQFPFGFVQVSFTYNL